MMSSCSDFLFSAASIETVFFKSDEGFENGFGHNGEGMHLPNLLTHLTAFFYEQNQQIQKLIDELTECVKQATNR